MLPPVRAAARMSVTARRWCLCAGILLPTLVLAGCAITYTQAMQQVDQDLAAQQPQAALKALERISGGGDRVLYLLNKAMVQRMAGDYGGSVQTFEQAKPLMQYLEATSVSETAAALTLTENLRTYQAALYERLLAHVYEGLSYLQLGQPDSARVEVAQVDDLLKRLYPGSNMAPHGGDAFPRYFSGLVYETLGEYSDAMIAYRQAYKAYKVEGRSDAAMPQDLKISLCRFADYLGLSDERDQYKQGFGIDSWPPVRKDDPEGQVIFIFSDGLAPTKVAQTAVLQNPLNGRFYSLTLPVLRRRTPSVASAQVSASGAMMYTEQVANIAADASQQMATDRPRLLADEFARNVTREIAAKQADKQQQGLGVLVSFMGTVADQADTRIWGTLPDNIQLARLRLAPGSYDLSVSWQGPYGTTQAPQLVHNVSVRAGTITFSGLQYVSFH